jgi:hypothetical protein
MVDDIAEKIRVRIMQEAYDLADRNDSEGYNSVKVMCSDVLALLPRRKWVGLTDAEITELHHEIKVRLMGTYKTEDIYRAIEAKLREKNGIKEET